jgi:hypothetical protein
LVIKRVASVPGGPVPESVRSAAGGISVVPDGKLVLLSDNPAGNDSRRWGLISGNELLGPVISTLPQGPRPNPGRRGQARRVVADGSGETGTRSG